MQSFRIFALFSICATLLSLCVSEQAQARFGKGYSKVTVIFIPGIYGSVLKDKDGNVFWGNNGIGKNGLSLERYPDLVPSLFEDVKFNIGVLGANVKGYSGVRQNLKQLGEKVRVFAYDWRQSNRKSGEKLQDFLCELFPSIQKDERIVFVAHSMGGLVLRHWIKDHMGQVRPGCNGIGIENIRSFTFAGTPHAGSMEPIRTLFTGKTSLDTNPVYSWFFTGRMASDAITFESVYELLPSASISGPDCAADEDDSASYLEKDIGTGKPVPIFLDNIETWRSLGIPVSLPSDVSRDAALALVEKRIKSASGIVCDLRSYKLPPAVVAKTDFIVGELRDNSSDEYTQSTVDSILIEIRPSKPAVLKESFGKGDGTVPYWSAEPTALGLAGYSRFPHQSNRMHAEILDDTAIVTHLQRVIEDAAYDVALLGDKPFGQPIKTKEQWFKALAETKTLSLETMSPETYSALVSHLSESAASLNISGAEIYKSSKDANRPRTNREKSVGFAVAANVGTDLNNISKVWASQNATIAILNSGNKPLATASALRTGKFNAEIANEPETSTLRNYKSHLNDVERRWKKVVASTTSEANAPELRSSVKSSPNFDIKLFDSEAISPYATLALGPKGENG